MEYERIHKVQSGIISPSKLRMKLMGPHHQRKKEGSNGNSARTSPSKLPDSEFVKNSLLATNGDDFDDRATASVSEFPSAKSSKNQILDVVNGDQNFGRVNKTQHFSKGEIRNSSSINPVRMPEDDNLDYDSTSSFEFHRGERSLHGPIARSISRPMPSKWNDAEKWIINRQNVQNNYSKKNYGNRAGGFNTVRVAPDCGGSDHKLAVKRVDFCQTSMAKAGLENGEEEPSVDLCKDLEQLNKSTSDDSTGARAIRSVSMRDMGTEMTPIPSQEPSTTTTPLGASTPLRSPVSSIPSTPRGGAPASSPAAGGDGEFLRQTEKESPEEEDLKVKTRKEIVALGLKLGKMNIAAWANNNEENEKKKSEVERFDDAEIERVEFGKRADAWEEAEKAKHAARYKREEIKIEAWESRQKSKLEAEMRRVEARVEEMRVRAQAEVSKKMAMARRKLEEKRVAAEFRKNRHAEKAAAQAEYICQTGRIPQSPFICCGW